MPGLDYLLQLYLAGIQKESVEDASAEGDIAVAHDDNLQFAESEDLVRPSQKTGPMPDSTSNMRTKDIRYISAQGMQPDAEAGPSSIKIESISEQPCGNPNLSFFARERLDADRDSMYSNG